MTKYVVGRVDAVAPGERLLVEVEGRSVGVFNVNGEFYALLNRCPHAGAELCKAGHLFGVVSAEQPDAEIVYSRRGELLRCPWHLWEFDLKTGQSWFDPRGMKMRTYRVEVLPGSPEVMVDLQRGIQKGPFVLEGYEASVDSVDGEEVIVVDTGRRRRGITSASLAASGVDLTTPRTPAGETAGGQDPTRRTGS